LEALINEKNEALERITEFLTPRITGEIECNVQERIECEQERVALSSRIAEIDVELAKLIDQEQRIADIDDMELPFDFDADFGTEGLNTIVRQMLKEERASNYATFNSEYERIVDDCRNAISGFEEREIQSKRQNEELQGTISKYSVEIHNLQETVDAEIRRRGEAELMLFETNGRMAEVEQNRYNAVAQLEEAKTEIERLERLVDEQRIQNAFGERGLQRTIDVTQTVNDLYEQAKQATAEKRKVMVTAELGLYREVQDADGNKETVHHSELAGMEQVDSFHIELPSIENPTEMPEVESQEIFQGEDAGLPDVQQGTEQEDSRSEQPAVGENAEIAESWSNEQITMFLLGHERRISQLETAFYAPTIANVEPPETERVA
jgi:hypothetical protein